MPGSPTRKQLTQEAIETLESISFSPKEIKEIMRAQHRKNGISASAVKDVISEMNNALEENLDLEARKKLYHEAQEWTTKCAAIQIFYDELQKKIIKRMKENLSENSSRYLLPANSRKIACDILVTAFLIQAHIHYQTFCSSTEESKEILRKNIEDRIIDIEAFNGTDFVTELGISSNQFQEAQSKLLEVADNLEVDLSDDSDDDTSSIEEISENETDSENADETRLTIGE